MSSKYPVYLESFKKGTLSKVAQELWKRLSSCNICPRACKIDRLKGHLGFCKTSQAPKVYSFMDHHGEEPPVSGTKGSGTVFFSCCNMGCVYCQNYEFSQIGQGRQVQPEELGQIMLDLQAKGCHNINLVTPTHVLPMILKALLLAIPKGLSIPLVYNTGGYELPEIIEKLAGIVDIYLADMRYGDEQVALKYSCAADYPKYNQASVKLMHQQVGEAKIDAQGLIRRGLIIRHLVLPNGLSGTGKIMRFISSELSTDTYISLMSQYLPYYKAAKFPDIARRLTLEEYSAACGVMQKYGLHNGWTQDSYGLERFAGVHIKPFFKLDENHSNS